MIKYKSAQDESGKLVYIHDLNEKNRNDSKYFCLSCGNELIPKLGKIKECHFAHKKVVTCSGETYLHLLGKKLFYENYKECLEKGKPFFVEYYQKQTCNHYKEQFQKVCKLGKTIEKVDLTLIFDKIYLEQRESTFIPDIMLESKTGNDKIFIEIAVTHASNDNKLLSGYRIIEFDIENEYDLEPIKEKYLSVLNAKIKFRNFKIKETTDSICKGNCEKEFNFFTLNKNGKALLKQRTLKQISQILYKEKDQYNFYHITYDIDSYYPGIYKYYIAKCATQDIKVNNCFICRYHAQNESLYEDTRGVPIFCKFLKIKCNSNQAIQCEYYKPDSKYIYEYLVDGEEYIIEVPIDLDDNEAGFKSDDEWLG